MKIPAIKKLVENISKEDLMKAEENLLEGNALGIEVEGDDEGEQLTHIMAARWILVHMKSEGVDFRTAMRSYTVKVRKSIS